jgi:hypothetical protein
MRFIGSRSGFTRLLPKRTERIGRGDAETIAVTDEWDKVDKALDGLEHYRVLHPTLVAMRRLVDMVKHDAALACVRRCHTHRLCSLENRRHDA